MADLKTYQLILAEIRALSEQQRTGISGHVEELRHLVRLAIALLAGILAALGLIGQADWTVTAPAVGLTAASLVSVLSGAMDAVRAAAGRSNHELPLGPDPEALLGWTDATEAGLLAALAEAESRQFTAADRLGRLLARAIRRATRLLLAGTLLAALAMARIVGGAIQ